MAKEFNDFIHQVNQLLSDVEQRRQVGEKGLTIAHQRFSWDSIADQLEFYVKNIC
jgi:glycosyltransferase involved in cell wall biosynthesis